MSAVREFLQELPAEERKQFEAGPAAPGKDEWPEPGEISTGQLLPVAILPPAAIPAPFRPWLTDIAHRMQCPLDFVAVGAMVAASSIIGAGCAIRPKKKDDWEVVPNLWGGIIARPSMMKTPALAEVIKSLARLEEEAGSNFDEETRFYEAALMRHKAVKDVLQDEFKATAKGKGKPGRKMDEIEMELAALEEPAAPVRRRFKANDATIEKLAVLLNENPRGLLVFRDELTGLLTSWEREDRQQDRAFYLEAWNGQGAFTVDRIGRGTLQTKNVCLSILGGIQPSKLTAYLLQAADSLQNDGMLQRFQLLVFPDEPRNWKLVDERPDAAAKNAAYEIFKALAGMDFIAVGATQEGEDRPFFRFDEDGQEVFYEWLVALQAKLQAEERPLICEHLAKYRKLMPALALIIHLIDLAAGGPHGPVTADAAYKAVAWAEYLESHARRIYGLLGDVRMKAAAALAGKIKEKRLKDGFALRDIYRLGWQYLDGPELAAGACRELEEAGWIRREVDTETGGRPRATYRINPKIFPEK